MRKWMYFLLIIAVAWGAWTTWIKPAPDIQTFSSDHNIHIQQLQPYEGTFRVLSREDYHTGREAQFSPMDIAVGWGEMANPSIYKQINISQGNRWYHWRIDSIPPISLNDIATHSANMHLVPATPEIAKQLQQLKKDDLVFLKGALIEIQSSDGWRWRSSLSREDTGAGACELMRVDQIIWHEQ
ncbi:hypothetical protein [Acinetobacter ursingii]|uniref:Uncharacterized protein n=1 Tax=Acinetobacter ursingii TaxID=108980 RepID=A0AA46P129_9GAMM|nr:hypothetical protein [Acinetobacter ursingii]MCH2016746.1 hypothetical protein [Acinetobacter ursingii]MCU4350750.1 hypothetical protein [Acinetobacter ursingii]UYF71030.1 hypothetical protein LSO60_12295 [Acinetobacter ursingii]